MFIEKVPNEAQFFQKAHWCHSVLSVVCVQSSVKMFVISLGCKQIGVIISVFVKLENGLDGGYKFGVMTSAKMPVRPIGKVLIITVRLNSIKMNPQKFPWIIFTTDMSIFFSNSRERNSLQHWQILAADEWYRSKKKRNKIQFHFQIIRS